MGSVRRSPRGRAWEARYRDALGRQRTKAFPTKADARAFLGTVDIDIAQGRWRDPSAGNTSFSEAVEQWLASNPAKRLNTYARDAGVLRVHFQPKLGSLPLSRLTPGHVQAAVNDMVNRGLQPRTVRTNYGVFRAVLNWAVDMDLIERSPCRRVRLPAVVRQAKPTLSGSDVLRLADALPAEYRATVFLGALGLRQAEVFGLHVQAINFDARTITVSSTLNEVNGVFVFGVGKTDSSSRTFAAPQRVIEELRNHLQRTGRTGADELVFQAPLGGPVRATNFRLRIYNPALRAVGLEGLSFHRLRHSAGDMMRELGVPLEIIQRRLGHASIRTTADVYGSLPAKVDRAVADQLDDLFVDKGDADVHHSRSARRDGQGR